MDDPVLPEFHLTDDSNGTTVYYTILEDNTDSIDDPAVLNIESDEFLADNVFYLSFDNENDQNIVEDESEESKTILTNSLFEEITLPDGSHAYLKNNSNIEMIEDNSLSQIQSSSQIVENSLCTNQDLDTQSTSEKDAFEQVTSNDTDSDTQYEQVQFEDGTFAIIESNLLKSFYSIQDQMCTQQKKQPSKELLKAYDCPHENCTKSYTTMHHLKVHMRIHTGFRPYKCKFEGCDKALSTGYSLKTHLRTHTGEKPYSCQYCSKSFKTSGDLQKHVRIHTGEKPFMCPIDGCGKSFTTSNIRKVHIRSHTGERPYVCEWKGCGKAFASATNYKNHVRIHSGEKPYACTFEGCGKRFTEYSSLYKHNLVHSNHKLSTCEYCGRMFTPASLVSHKRIAHNIMVTNSGTEVMLKLDPSKLCLISNENNEAQLVLNMI